MLDILSALQSAGVPAFRGAFRPTAEYPEPPDTYCVYLTSRTPDWPADDSDTAERRRAFLHLYALSDPEAAQAAIEAAMRAEGWRLAYVNDDYVEGSGHYEVLSEWTAVEAWP